MPAPYSIDLRQRVINAYKAKEGSQRQIAKRFQVSESFLKRLIRRYQETGSVKSRPHGGGALAIIKQFDLEQIKQLVNEQPDALLRELCERWEAKKGIKVSISTMHRRLQKLQLTTKKAARPRVAERRKGTLAKTNSVCEGTTNSKN